jgi:hypothetical protein
MAGPARASLQRKVDDFLKEAEQLTKVAPPQVNRDRKSKLVRALGDMLQSLEGLA